MEYLIMTSIFIIGIVLGILSIKFLEGHFRIKSNEIISQEEYKYRTFKVLEIVHKITYDSNKIVYKQEKIYC